MDGVSGSQKQLESKFIILKNAQMISDLIYFIQDKTAISSEIWSLFDAYLNRLIKTSPLNSN
jgi:hypothetical protein